MSVRRVTIGAAQPKRRAAALAARAAGARGDGGALAAQPGAHRDDGARRGS